MFKNLTNLANALALPREWIEQEAECGRLPHLLIDGERYFLQAQVLEALYKYAEQQAKYISFMGRDFSEVKGI